MKKKRKKYIKIAVEVVAFILFIAVLGYGLQYVDNKTEKANVSDESSINDWKIQVPRGKIKLNGNKYEYYHDFENYLLIGTDATGNNNNGADYQGSMADFLMLVIVDVPSFNINHKTRMIFRYGKYKQIGCTVFFNASD